MRRKRVMQEIFYDVFADWEQTDQAIALTVLGEIHRQAGRQLKKDLAGVNEREPTLLDDSEKQTKGTE